MANQEQLAVLKQGVPVWNRWRADNSGVEIDLSEASFWGDQLADVNLSNADLRSATLIEANLIRCNLSKAKLNGADLTNAILQESNLVEADLSEARLWQAHLSKADLWNANLNEADLGRADIIDSILIRANLSGASLVQAELIRANLNDANLGQASLHQADLHGANLSGANLIHCNFSRAKIAYTIFGNSDLSKTSGLEDVYHEAPSSISTDTFSHSKGEIPEIFLKGCGLSDWEIESAKLYNPALTNEEIIKIQYRVYDLRATQAIQISPLFISYSHADTSFVEKLELYLTKKGIRFWRDIHDMKSGRMEKQVDRAMRLNPTVLLILSKHSLQSDWVEHEVRTARTLEKEMKKDVLCPVALDDSWKNSPWAKRIMEQVMEYNILDFSIWKDDAKFGNTFHKLIAGLELFYK